MILEKNNKFLSIIMLIGIEGGEFTIEKSEAAFRLGSAEAQEAEGGLGKSGGGITRMDWIECSSTTTTDK